MVFNELLFSFMFHTYEPYSFPSCVAQDHYIHYLQLWFNGNKVHFYLSNFIKDFLHFSAL